MNAILFANGDLPNPEDARSAIQPGDWVIAADGGARHCLRLGISPQIVIGDFDSLTQVELQTLAAGGAQLIHYPERKDFTDLELALNYAIDLSPSELHIFGALGSRWDQTLANLLLPAAERFRQATIWIRDSGQAITLIRNKQTLRLCGQPGDTVSLIPVGGNAAGITTQGLEYPLIDETLSLGATRGVSNVLLNHEAKITLADGLLVCIHCRIKC